MQTRDNERRQEIYLKGGIFRRDQMNLTHQNTSNPKTRKSSQPHNSSKCRSFGQCTGLVREKSPKLLLEKNGNQYNNQ